MIYASERDAKLSWAIGPDAIWRQSGPTGVRELRTALYCGTALITVSMCLNNVEQYHGTSVNAAVPLPLQAAPADHVFEPALTTPAQMVEKLRAAFGLNITQLAQIMYVERITVYAWLRTDRMEKLNAFNRKRLWRLYQIAKQWSNYEPLAGKYLLEIIPGRDKTLLQMLCDEQLDVGEFARAYELLARATSPSTRTQQHRAEQQKGLERGIENLRKNSGKFGMDLS